MTWFELRLKGEKLGYSVKTGILHPSKIVLFFEGGIVNIGEEVFTGISYDQMAQLMEILK